MGQALELQPGDAEEILEGDDAQRPPNLPHGEH